MSMYTDGEVISGSELQFLHEICDQLRAGVDEISSVKASLLQQPSSPPHGNAQTQRVSAAHKDTVKQRLSASLPLWRTAPLTTLSASEYAKQTTGSKRSLHLPPIERRPTSPLHSRKAAEQDARIAAKRSTQDSTPEVANASSGPAAPSGPETQRARNNLQKGAQHRQTGHTHTSSSLRASPRPAPPAGKHTHPQCHCMPSILVLPT